MTEKNTYEIPGFLLEKIETHVAKLARRAGKLKLEPIAINEISRRGHIVDAETGLMIPLVNTPEDAATLASAVKFPPLGQRGLDGASLDNNFYLDGTAAYPTQAIQETFLIVQIETPEALENIEAIAATPGLDGLFIGPGDLSLRLKCDPDWKHPKMAAAQDAVAAAAAKNHIAWGHPAGTAGQISAMAQKGARLIAHGSDFSALYSALPNFGKTLASGLKE